MTSIDRHPDYQRGRNDAHHAARNPMKYYYSDLYRQGYNKGRQEREEGDAQIHKKARRKRSS